MFEQGYVLYSQPSFLEGMARLVDFAGSLNVYNYAASPDEADARALLSDWEAVGFDLLSAKHELDESKAK